MPLLVKMSLQYIGSSDIEMIETLVADSFFSCILICCRCKCDAFGYSNRFSNQRQQHHKTNNKYTHICCFFFRVRLFTCLATITRSFSVYSTRHRIFAYASKLICCFLFFFVSLPISSFHTKSHLFIYFKFFYSILHRSFLCYCCCCCFPHYFSRSHSLKLIFV